LIFLLSPILAQHSIEDSINIQDSWFGMDKVRHITYSFLWVLTIQYIAENKFDLEKQEAFPISFFSTASIGLLKEIHDWKKPNNHFCLRDMIADGIGLCLASMIIFAHF